MALFNASLILLVNVWRGRGLKGSTSAAALDNELVDVYKCINLLSSYETRSALDLGILVTLIKGQ